MQTDERIKVVCPKCKAAYLVTAFPVFCSCGSKIVLDETATTLTFKIVHYLEAIQKWRDAGKPVRPDAEIESILATHCRPCEFFNNGICEHQKCGCTLSTGDGGRIVSRIAVRASRLLGLKPIMFEKLRMGTEECPIGKW
jgi:hypothetical protein